MLRKMICLLLFLCLCAPVLSEDAPSHLYHFTSAAEAPKEVAADIAALFGTDVTYIDGYAAMRFGKWTNGQIILQDTQGYLLCGLSYAGDDASSTWHITSSRTALRQDALPTLLPEGAEYGYDDYQVSQSDGCDSFKIVYDDLTYHWFAGSNGWALHTITDEANNLKLSITQQSITRYFADDRAGYTAQAKSVFNVLSPMLTDFDIAAFPTTWEDAKALSDASEYADQTQAVTVYDPWDVDFEMGDVTGIPLIKVYAQASRNSKVIAHIFDNVQVEILDHNNYSGNNLVNDWYLINILDFSGWVERDNLLIGSERAAAYHTLGDYAAVYGTAAQAEQPLYRSANSTSPSAYVKRNTRIYVQLITDDDWYLIRTQENALAWMKSTSVCMSDNYHEAYIYSSDPSKRLNLRTGPGPQYESIGKYYSGTRVVFMHQTEAKKGWRHVIIEGVSGYVNTEYLEMYADYYGKNWLPPLGKVRGVNEKGLNLRKAPSSKAEIIAAYPVGTSVEILGIYDSIWAHVRLQDGNTGYMMLQYLGGEPKKAAANSFKLTRDITTTDFDGNPLCEVKQGTRIRVAERPIDGQTYAPWIKSDDFYGYIPLDATNFW